MYTKFIVSGNVIHRVSLFVHYLKPVYLFIYLSTLGITVLKSTRLVTLSPTRVPVSPLSERS